MVDLCFLALLPLLAGALEVCDAGTQTVCVEDAGGAVGGEDAEASASQKLEEAEESLKSARDAVVEAIKKYSAVVLAAEDERTKAEKARLPFFNDFPRLFILAWFLACLRARGPQCDSLSCSSFLNPS